MMYEFNRVAGSRACHAEARVAAGGRTEWHYYKVTEELYFMLEGAGEVELDGERRVVGLGDANRHAFGRAAHNA